MANTDTERVADARLVLAVITGYALLLGLGWMAWWTYQPSLWMIVPDGLWLVSIGLHFIILKDVLSAEIRSENDEFTVLLILLLIVAICYLLTGVVSIIHWWNDTTWMAVVQPFVLIMTTLYVWKSTTEKMNFFP